MRYLAFALLMWAASGVEPAAAQPGTTPASEETSDYQVGPGDVLTLRVFGVQGLDQACRVSNSGKIHVRHLGIIHVDGMSVRQLEIAVGKALQERDLVKDPWVQARVQDYRAHPVYILGEVWMPGQYVITDQMYLLDLLALSWGLTSDADPVGYLYRRKASSPHRTGEDGVGPSSPDPGSTMDVLAVDFKALNEGTRPELNLRLRGGDILYVAKRVPNRFFVVGDVMKPGVFEIPRESTLMLTQAVSMAGGPTRTAKAGKGMLVRFDEGGVRHDLPVDFDAIIGGRQPDPFVEPNDIIFIPGSTAKTIGYGLLGAVPSVVQQSILTK